MRRVMAIAGLTWKGAFRYRLFWIMAAMLVASVTGLPWLLHDDGTAKGLAQILLTYTLSATTALLGLFTLWFACGVLARDVEEGQMQMVAVKPVARWQVWVGKWVGIVALNAALLGVAGGSIYWLLGWRAQKLPPDQQKVLRDEVFVARAGAKEKPLKLQPIIDKEIEKRLAKAQGISREDELEIRRQVAAGVLAAAQEVPPGYYREWKIDLSGAGGAWRGEPMQLRVKFHTSDTSEDARFAMVWQIAPESPRAVEREERLPADSFQEFDIPNDLVGDDGVLTVRVVNENEIPLLFSARRWMTGSRCFTGRTLSE